MNKKSVFEITSKNQKSVTLIEIKGTKTDLMLLKVLIDAAIGAGISDYSGFSNSSGNEYHINVKVVNAGIMQSEPLGPEFEKVLQDNLWDLLEEDTSKNKEVASGQ
jgi:hypothetical protein